MKKLLALLMVGILVFSFAACGKDGGKDGGKGGGAKEEKSEFLASADIGDLHYDLLGAELVEAEEENDTLRVYYDVTNLSEETLSEFSAWDDVLAFSGEEELETVKYTAYPDVPVDVNLVTGKDMRPGAKIRSYEQFNITGKTGIITFSISNDDAEGSIKYDFDLANLPAAPTDKFEVAPVADPKWTEGLEKSFTVDGECKAEILDQEVEFFDSNDFYNGGGYRLIRIKFKITNLGEEATQTYFLGSIKVFQDGVSLDRNSNTYCELSDSDLVGFDDLEPGDTVIGSDVFALRSTSPIEIELSNSDGTSTAAVVLEVK